MSIPAKTVARHAAGRALAICALISPLAAPAGAAPPERPAPTVEVTQDSHGASGVVRAFVDIDATPAAVWKVLTDCAAAPRMMVNLKSCRVLEQGAGGRWDVRETISRGALLPGVRTVVRADYDAPYRVRFHRVDGDLKVLEGEWRLTAQDGGAQTRVSYESRVAAPFAAPGFLVRSVLRHDMPLTLSRLRDACEQAASRAAP